MKIIHLEGQLSDSKRKNEELEDKVHFLNGKQIDLTKSLSESEKEHAKLLEKVQDLEKRLGSQVLENEAKTSSGNKLIVAYEGLVRDIWSIVDSNAAVTDFTCSASSTSLLNQILEFKTKYLVMADKVSALETLLESKESEINSLKAVNERLAKSLTEVSKNELIKEVGQRELEILKKHDVAHVELIENLEIELMEAREKISILETKIAKDFENHLKTKHCHDRSPKDLLIRSLSRLLSTPENNCPPTDSIILDRVRWLLADYDEKARVHIFMEKQIAELELQLDSYKCQNNKFDYRSEKYHDEVTGLRDRCRNLQLEINVLESAKNNYVRESERYFDFLLQLGEKLRLDANISTQTNVLELQKMLLLKMDQYMLNDELNENSISDRIAGLSRRVSRLQDQLASKEVQLDLWRVKCAKLEAKLEATEAGEGEIEKKLKKAEKQAKNAKRVEEECSKLKDELLQLRSQMYDNSNAMVSLHSANEKVGELMSTVAELERQRDRQAGKLAELTALADMRTKEGDEIRGRGENAVASLAEELRSTRRAMEQLRKSEREVQFLLDFRSLVARSLGLDVSTIAMPNYEIVRRIERLISTQQPLSNTTFSRQRMRDRTHFHLSPDRSKLVRMVSQPTDCFAHHTGSQFEQTTASHQSRRERILNKRESEAPGDRQKSSSRSRSRSSSRGFVDNRKY
ncbi:hypothetical protein Ciccas_000520 [Cichlidogyrus casuarinus]|uniref:Coiled-coil domain-containing protein 170 n=1 Tax=Cichlidogyrus casuarinus TaxID=1844966 RepID=A0ABD2QMN1_9PLAT